jgi:hypothetical protein
MNEEYRKKEEPRDAGLTTAALAGVGERTPSKKELDLRVLETEPREGRFAPPVSQLSMVTALQPPGLQPL